MGRDTKRHGWHANDEEKVEKRVKRGRGLARRCGNPQVRGRGFEGVRNAVLDAKRVGEIGFRKVSRHLPVSEIRGLH